MKYKISYWYLATGMEGKPDSKPEVIIEADSEDEAKWKYQDMMWQNRETFKEFMAKSETYRNWGLSVEKINDHD